MMPTPEPASDDWLTSSIVADDDCGLVEEGSLREDSASAWAIAGDLVVSAEDSAGDSAVDATAKVDVDVMVVVVVESSNPQTPLKSKSSG